MTLYTALWSILVYSVLGWCIEVVFVSANTGHFVNRGFLNGPWCPIYGFGATAVVVLLRPLAGTFLPLFLGSVLVTSALELVTGWLLLRLFHARWWDYSDQPFNIGGFVCLKFSLAWGLACILLVRVIHPGIAGLVGILPRWVGVCLLVILYGFFIADSVVTVNAVLKLNRDLGEMTRIAEGLHRQSETIAKSLGGAAVSAADRIEELDIPERVAEGREKWEESRARRETERAAQREKWEAGWAASKERLTGLVSRHRPTRARLLRAFPNMRHQYDEALEELREWYRAQVEKNADKTGNKSDKKQK